MISIEKEVFNDIRTLLKIEFPNCSVANAPLLKEPSFPFVFVDEFDNYTYKRTVDSRQEELHSVVSYQIDIYSRDRTDRKAEAKQIAQAIDNYFVTKGFNRKSNAHLYSDDTVTYRITLTYTAIVGADNHIYRR